MGFSPEFLNQTKIGNDAFKNKKTFASDSSPCNDPVFVANLI